MKDASTDVRRKREDDAPGGPSMTLLVSQVCSSHLRAELDRTACWIVQLAAQIVALLLSHHEEGETEPCRK